MKNNRNEVPRRKGWAAVEGEKPADMEDTGDQQPKEVGLEMTEAVVAEQATDTEARGHPRVGVDGEHPEPNRVGEPEQQQQPESDRAKEQEK